MLLNRSLLTYWGSRKVPDVVPLDGPIVDRSGLMLQRFRTWTLKMLVNDLVIGTGSPEGVLEFPRGTRYMDDAGAV